MASFSELRGQVLHWPYIYTPLQDAHKQIRLLQIMPERPNLVGAAHEIALRTFSLDQAPPYAALSYEWGSEEDLQTIILDSRLHQIPKNLDEFFNHFRKVCTTDGPSRMPPFALQTYLWVDQISINQANISERNRQVMIMAEIFAHAEGVIAWLGPNNDTQSCLQAFPSGYRHMSDHRHKFDSHLPDLSYWQRHWIAQELASARQVTYLYGEESLYADDIVAVEIWQDSSFLKILHLVYSPYRRDLMGICSFSSSSVCQDPRDKIFGIQNLLPKSARLEVDYRCTVHELYTQAAHIYVNVENLAIDDAGRIFSVIYFLSVMIDIAVISCRACLVKIEQR